MAVTAGALSKVNVGSNSAQLVSAPATGGTGPYTYQWYRDITSGFTPGAGNIIDGATALTMDQSGLIPNSTYYYKVVATDTGAGDATSNSAALAVTTLAPSLSQNSFKQSSIVGMVDQAMSPNTIAAQIDSSESGTLYPGDAVKIVDSAGGVPKVVKVTADTDEVFGIINYNIKNASFVAGMAVELSQALNVVFLYATAPIARGQRVILPDPTAYRGAVAPAAGSGGATILGWAFDKASAAGDLIRVRLENPSFLKDGT